MAGNQIANHFVQFGYHGVQFQTTPCMGDPDRGPKTFRTLTL